jgi:transposase-like protein
MTKHEQKMIDLGCPDCKGQIELYDTNATGTGGRYRCKQCGRDTVWAVGKAISFAEIIVNMKAKLDKTPNKYL